MGCAENPGIETGEGLGFHRPRLSAALSRRRLEERAVEHTGTGAHALLGALVGAFGRTDEGLRVVVVSEHVAKVRSREDHVAVAFAKPVRLATGLGGSPPCVIELVLPLSGRWAKGDAWTFLYRDETGGWYALRWSAPEKRKLESLLDAALEVQETSR